jgi:uncharacterized protein (DUF1810 family)
MAGNGKVSEWFKKDMDRGGRFLCKFLGIRKRKFPEVNIDRFVDAQREVYAQVRKELIKGRKETDWMWYIFPQLRGLGKSELSDYYGIGSQAEAKLYMQNEELQKHMEELCRILVGRKGKDITEMLSYPDDLKLRSCMTLFLETCPEYPYFKQVLDKYYNGVEDMETVKILDRLDREEQYNMTI